MRERAYDVDGDHYEILTSVAEALAGKHYRRDDTAAGDDQLFPAGVQAIQARRSAPARLLRPIIGDQGLPQLSGNTLSASYRFT